MWLSQDGVDQTEPLRLLHLGQHGREEDMVEGVFLLEGSGGAGVCSRLAVRTGCACSAPVPTAIERNRLSLTVFPMCVEDGPEMVAESRTHLPRFTCRILTTAFCTTHPHTPSPPWNRGCSSSGACTVLTFS